MVDVVEGLAKGKCLDLSQSLPIENLNIKIEGTTDISAIKDSKVIIITAGIARKPGMSRDDLIETNFSIMNEIGKAIKKFSPLASKGSKKLLPTTKNTTISFTFGNWALPYLKFLKQIGIAK